MAKTAAEKAYELGKEYEKTRKGCSQCVIAALQDALDIKNDDIFKAATGLVAGGGAAIDGSCGSYVGAIMVLSSLLGRDRNNFIDLDQTVGFRTLELVRKFRDKYIKEYGSVVDGDDFKKFEDAGGHGDKGCPEVVGKAARWMAELILEENLLHYPV